MDIFTYYFYKNMKKILIKDLSFCYKIKQILHKVNLTIEKDDFIGIIGPNGGGKSTLLKLIMGFYTPHTGYIKIFNKTPKEARDLIGYVPQSYNTDKSFPITVLDVVLMGIYKNSKFGFFSKKQKEMAAELLKDLGLKDEIHKQFGKLSGGQIQKVLIARALISDPEILILDEPTANIDNESEKKIFELLLSKKRTILMVSHDLQTIVTKVKNIFVVDTNVQSFLPKDICEHFKLGLYHNPLLGNKNE